MKNLWLFIPLLLVACARPIRVEPEYAPIDIAPGTPPCLEQRPDGSCGLFDASFIQLVAHPEVFDGARVRVTGYANLQFEGNALYLSRELFRRGSLRDAIWLDLKGMTVKPPFKRGYADIEGTFNAKFRGHFGMFAASITKITMFTKAIGG